MRRWLLPAVLAVALHGCNSAPDEAASVAVVARFHAALNAGDWPAIDALLSQSARDLRPGGGTARAFRAITARHGRYKSGALAGINRDEGRTSVAWSARYERGPVSELFVLNDAGGAVQIDSYTDRP
jgi:hypothetical protein